MIINPRPIVIRPAEPGDATALVSMFGRCSEQTRYRRFHGVVTEMPAAYLRRCLGQEPPAQEAFVAELVTGAASGGVPRLIGLASAGPVLGASHVREVGVLVEDGRQRQGIGRMLFAALLAGADATGVRLIRLELCRAQPSLLAYVLANMDVVAVRSSGCDVTVDVTVPVIRTRGDQRRACSTVRANPAEGRVR